MSDDILRADPRLRRLTLVILGVSVVAALVGLYWFRHWLQAIVDQPGTDLVILRLRRTIALALTGSALCLALLAGYSAHLGALAGRARQWPLPGARVVRDTPIRRGIDAARIGKLLRVAAMVLLLLALVTGFVSWRMLT